MTSFRALRLCGVALLLLCFATAVAAQQQAASNAARGITVRPVNVYQSPDASSSKLAEMERGREVVVLERTKGWARVLAAVTGQRDVSGWMLDKGIVFANTPNGDQILFGEAAEAEDEATRRGGRRGADREAGRLYYYTAEYFPTSPLAAKAMFRGADIRWQLERDQLSRRPSAKEPDPDLRPKVEEEYMRQVMKKFPNTEWADRAALLLIDNKLCGDWQSQPKCPEREAKLYEDYAKDRPSSVVAAEALYQAAYRRAAAADMYQADKNAGKAEENRTKARELASRAASATNDWGTRARRLTFLLDQNVAVYTQAPE